MRIGGVGLEGGEGRHGTRGWRVLDTRSVLRELLYFEAVMVYLMLIGGL